MNTEPILTAAVMSQLSGSFHTVLYRDEAGWEYSVTAVGGIVLPTRIFISRLLAKMLRSDENRMRDLMDNLSEVSTLSMRCGLDDVPDFAVINQKISEFITRQRADREDTVEHFKQMLSDIFDGIEQSCQDVVKVTAIPAQFSRTRPDLITPQPFGSSVSVPDAFPA